MASNNTLVHISPIQSIMVDLVETVEANTPYYDSGFHGMIMEDANSGDSVAMDVSARTWQVKLTGLSVGKGDSIYIDTTTNDLTADDTDRWFAVLVTDKDSDDVADILLAPQSDSQA
jgi:hypothetical protein